MWRIGKVVSDGRYMSAVLSDHPHADKNGHVYLHRVVMENRLHRLLKRHEVVHHRNGDGKDNRYRNLKLTTLPAHSSWHSKSRGVAVDEFVCPQCRRPFLRELRQAKGTMTFCSRRCVRLYYGGLDAGVVRHGTRTTYRYRGCRCAACKKANADYMRKLRKRLRGVA